MEKLYWIKSGARVRLALPKPAERPANFLPEADLSCACGDKRLAGASQRFAADDRAYESDAYCYGCKAPRGLLRLETNTLFGVREDEAVLQGRCRIY